jgi:hypothetical protein
MKKLTMSPALTNAINSRKTAEPSVTELTQNSRPVKTARAMKTREFRRYADTIAFTNAFPSQYMYRSGSPAEDSQAGFSIPCGGRSHSDVGGIKTIVIRPAHHLKRYVVIHFRHW